MLGFITRWLRGLFGRPDPVSLMLLLDEKPSLDGPAIVAAVRRALPVSAPNVIELPSQQTPQGEAACRVVEVGDAAYSIIATPFPLEPDPQAGAADIEREDFAAAYGSHVATIAVELAKGSPDDAESVVGQIAAELLSPSCVLLICGSNHGVARPSAELTRALRTGDWLEAFNEESWEVMIDAEGEDPELAAATEEAKRTFPEFIRRFESGEGARFTVKAPFQGAKRVEHMWVVVESIEAAGVRGELGNDPRYVENLQCGDPVTVALDDVEDWMIRRGDDWEGGFSVRILAARSGVEL